MMSVNTTQEVEERYDVSNGIITSPGKFEGQPVYLPAALSVWLDGHSIEDDGNEILVEVDFDGQTFEVCFMIDEQGFAQEI